MQFSYASNARYPPVPSQPRHNHYSDPDADYEVDSDTEFTIANNSWPNGLTQSRAQSTIGPFGFFHYYVGTYTLRSPQSPITTPLQHIEALLIAKLVPPNEEEATQLAGPGYPSPTESHFSMHTSRHNGHGHHRSQSYRNQEIFVRPGPGWKGGLSRARVNFSDNFEPHDTSTTSNGHRPMSAGNTGLETPDEPAGSLAFMSEGYDSPMERRIHPRYPTEAKNPAGGGEWLVSFPLTHASLGR